MITRSGPPSRRALLSSLGATAMGISLSPLAGCGRGPAKPAGGEEATLNFYNWDTYIGKTTLADFKAASGIDVHMSLFASNDELFAKLRGGNPGYDVIVPSNETVTRLAEAKLLMPLDHTILPNMANLDSQFQDAVFDKGRQYSVPYTWGVLGIGYRKSKVKSVPDSWKVLFESDEYKSRIAVMSESGDLMRVAAKYLGHSAVGIGPDTIAKIEALLTKQKPNIKTFHDDNGQDLLAAGDVDLVMENAGDIAQVMREDKDLDFVVPKEGSLLYQDCLCIPAGAPRPGNAHRFINYILDAKAEAEIIKTILYATPNEAAKKLMPPDYQNNPVIFPKGEGMDKSEYGLFEGADQARQFEEAMTKIRAA